MGYRYNRIRTFDFVVRLMYYLLHYERRSSQLMPNQSKLSVVFQTNHKKNLPSPCYKRGEITFGAHRTFPLFGDGFFVVCNFRGHKYIKRGCATKFARAKSLPAFAYFSISDPRQTKDFPHKTLNNTQKITNKYCTNY
jgi:hypothetical protein